MPFLFIVICALSKTVSAICPVIPYDRESPMVTSGMRLGTPAITTRGLKEKDIIELVNYMDEALTNYDNEKIINSVAKKVDALCKKYPIYKYISEM